MCFLCGTFLIASLFYPISRCQRTNQLSLRRGWLSRRRMEDDAVTMAKQRATTAIERVAQKDAQDAPMGPPITNREHAPNHKKVQFKASHALLIAFLTLIMSVEERLSLLLQGAADVFILASCRSSEHTSSPVASSSRDLFLSTSQHAPSLP